MTVLPATLVALTLLGATEEAPSHKPNGGDVAPETRIEPTRPEDAPGSDGLLMLGLRLHGPRFKVYCEGTRRSPLVVDLPLGDFLRLRFVHRFPQ